MSRRIIAAMALALGATSLTASAHADTDDHSTQVAPPVGTPLELRPSKPVQLAPQPNLAGATWKIVAILGALGITAVLVRKGGRPRAVGDGNMLVVRRMAAGFRSELLIVNVEGQRLLIGVTPHNIQTLAVLDVEESTELEPAGSPASTVGERFAAMLDSAAGSTTGIRQTESSPARTKPTTAGGDDPADQARGLLALRRRA